MTIPENRQKKNKLALIFLTIFMGLLLAASLLYNFYLYQQKTEVSKDLGEMELTQESLDGALLKVKNEFESLQLDYENLQSENAEQNALLEQKNSEIEEKSEKVRQLLSKGGLTDDELREARSLIISLKKDLESYKKEIALLQEENQVLRTEKDSLIVRGDSISRSLTSTQQKVQQLDSDIKSTLSISQLKIKSYKVRNSGKLVETDNANRVDRLDFSFTVDPNPNTSNGSKYFYVAVFDPNGRMINLPNGQNGSLTLKNGSKVTYSETFELNYAGKSSSMHFNYDREEFAKGEYVVKVYQNGYKVGENRIALR